MAVSNKENSSKGGNAQAANELIFTTLEGGPRSRKPFVKAIQKVIEEDSSAKVKFYALLNRKPYKDDEKLDEEALVEMMKKNPDFCQSLYRFEAFHQDLIHPLHMLAALSADVATIRTCFKYCEAAMFYDESSLGSPIHYAVTFNASFEIIRWLVKKDMDALLLPNKDKQTPLHLACLYEADSETCFFLTDRCAKAAQAQDKEGNTPLHLACSGEEPDLEIVEDLTEVRRKLTIAYIVIGTRKCRLVFFYSRLTIITTHSPITQVFPGAGLIKAENGKTPLMLAIGAEAETPILRDLICSCPEAAGVANRNGSTPLHLALRRKCDFTVIKDLVIAAKETCQMKDKKWGNLPVHTAVSVGCNDLQVYKLLARKYPDGLEEANKAGDTPHAMALKAKGLDDEVVDFLNPFEECSD